MRTTLIGVAFAVLSCATPAGSAFAQPLRNAAGGYEVEVLVNGAPVPTFAHNGETYVLGQMGERYTLRIWNRTGRRIEAVVSVDGRDVVDGRPGDFRNKRGYLVPAWGSVDIDGWRLSARQAAAFRFTTVADSYAGRMGNARNVGVIGVAVFPERVYYQPRPRPIYPRDDYRSYGPRDRDYYGYSDEEGASGGYGSRAEAPSERKGEPAAPPAAAPPTASPTPPSADAARSKSAEAPTGRSYGDGALAESRPAPAPPRYRPGLGTEFGESMTSHVQEVSFTRASASSPSVMLGMRYNDRAGLIALGIDVDGRYYYGADDNYLRQTANPFPVSHPRYSAPPPGWRRY